MDDKCVTLILSVVVAVCTFIYTGVNIFMLVESRRTRKQKITPLIVAYLKTWENHEGVSLFLENIGEGLALDVEIIVKKDYLKFEKEENALSSNGIFKDGISIFPPRYMMKFDLNYWSNIIDNKNINDYIEIKVLYKRVDNERIVSVYRLCFNEINGQMYQNPPDSYIGQIAYSLNEISKKFTK